MYKTIYILLLFITATVCFASKTYEPQFEPDQDGSEIVIAPTDTLQADCEESCENTDNMLTNVVTAVSLIGIAALIFLTPFL